MKSKSKIYQLGFAVALTLTAGLASAEQDTYINAQIGLPSVAGFSGGLAMIATYGMPMKKLMPSLDESKSGKVGFEAEFTTSLLSNPSWSLFNTTLEYSYNTFAGYALYTKVLSPELTFRGRGGLIVALRSIDGPYGSSSDTAVGLSYGIGAVYKLSGDMDAIVEYTLISADISHLSAGVQFSF